MYFEVFESAEQMKRHRCYLSGVIITVRLRETYNRTSVKGNYIIKLFICYITKLYINVVFYSQFLSADFDINTGSINCKQRTQESLCQGKKSINQVEM